MDLNSATFTLTADAPPAKPRGCTWLRLRKLARRLTQRYDQFLRPSGLRITQFSLLANLSDGGSDTVTALAERMAMDRTTLSRNLKPLVEGGLLALDDGADGRSKRVSLTPAGKAAFEAAYPLWRNAQKQMQTLLGNESLAELHDRLDLALSQFDGAGDI